MSARVIASPSVPCPVCERSGGLCCTNEHGAVRRGGPHPERLAAQQAIATCQAGYAPAFDACGAPAIGLYRRACVHEHVRDGYLCALHVLLQDAGLCLDCHNADGHECPITIQLLEEVAR